MDATQTIMSYISSVGFPIIMCLLMFKQINELRDVIANNTLAVQKLVQKMGVEDNGRTDV